MNKVKQIKVVGFQNIETKVLKLLILMVCIITFIS